MKVCKTSKKSRNAIHLLANGMNSSSRLNWMNLSRGERTGMLLLSAGAPEQNLICARGLTTTKERYTCCVRAIGQRQYTHVVRTQLLLRAHVDRTNANVPYFNADVRRLKPARLAAGSGTDGWFVMGNCCLAFAVWFVRRACCYRVVERGNIFCRRARFRPTLLPERCNSALEIGSTNLSSPFNPNRSRTQPNNFIYNHFVGSSCACPISERRVLLLSDCAAIWASAKKRQHIQQRANAERFAAWRQVKQSVSACEIDSA